MQRIRIQLDDGTQLRAVAVKLADALQIELGNSLRGKFPAGHSVLQFGNADLFEGKLFERSGGVLLCVAEPAASGRGKSVR